jgi:hypothetical protein
VTRKVGIGEGSNQTRRDCRPAGFSIDDALAYAAVAALIAGLVVAWGAS